MRTIGLDLLFLEPGATGGMEVYARALVPRLADAWPKARLLVFGGRELGEEWRERPWHPNVSIITLPVSSSTRVRRTIAEQTLLVASLARHRVDLVHSMGNTTPLATTVPAVVTIHDVIYKRFPAAHAGVLSKGLGVLVPLTARRAARIVTHSQATAADLQRFLGVDPAKITVIPSGPGADPSGAPTPESELRQRLEIPEGPIVLSPSAHRPHKNLERLIDAMSALDATLVVPGYATHFDETLQRRADDARVVFCGWLSESDLEGLYRAATCLAFPSLAEGFGMPVLEAMRRGLPVACSDATSLPEVAGDAALLFDPRDSAEIARAVRRLLEDPDLRRDLTIAGREQAKHFSWATSAEHTAAVYKATLA